MKIKVGVIFGGESVEHEVSIISAIQAMEHMNQDKYDIYPIYISKDRTWYAGKMLMDIDVFKNFDDLKKYAKKVTMVKKNDKFYLQKVSGILRRDITDIDIVFPIVHGNNVEDGSIQGYLDTIGIPYVGSKVLGSALGQDKVVMKQVFKSVDLPIVDYTWFYDYEYNENKSEILDKIKAAVKEHGNLLNIFAINVNNASGNNYSDGTKFKLKLTDEMKKYNSFKFIYIDDENNFKVGDIVDFKIEGDYLVGTLPHLSVYALVGNTAEEKKEDNSKNPKTADTIIKSVVMLVICVSGLVTGLIYYKKRKTSKN